MKKLKTVFKWILLSILLQTAVLSYLNFVYLPNRGKYKATAYEKDSVPVKNRSYILPEGAVGVSVSFDGLYAAYMKGSNVVIADIDKEKSIRQLNPAGGSITYYKWLPDREMLIYAVKEPGGKKGRVRIATYDIGPGLERSYPDIDRLPEGSEVVNIELSPLTNIVCPVIKTGRTEVGIYKFDIMDNLTLVMKTDLNTVIKETMYSDNLVYQPAGGNIRIRNGTTGETSQVPLKEAKLLLAVDGYDYIYAADTDINGMVTAIYYGKAGQKKEEWRRIAVQRATKAENIFVTLNGSVYAADHGEGIIVDLESKARTRYEGELLTVLDDYLVSVNGNKLLFGALN
ncbi:MAG: hypothetical protein ACOX4M_06360 [Acetivibrionales bacterium]|jgi:hypothetical protein